MWYTVIGAMMSLWKWRETKLQPSRARSGHQISCCLVSLHFLCDILALITIHEQNFAYFPTAFSKLKWRLTTKCEKVEDKSTQP